MELIRDTCHWCEVEISRPSENLLWIDNYESSDCEFHPAAYDSNQLKATGVFAPHQTLREVHSVIAEDFLRKQQMRNKTTRLRIVTHNTVTVSRTSKVTSAQAAEKFLPRSGSLRQKVYEAVKNRKQEGLTDYELEQLLNGKHQTVSASRRSLVIDGWLVDSGKTRRNPQDNDCIVWIEKDEVFSGLLFV